MIGPWAKPTPIIRSKFFSANARIALMVSTMLDTEGKPANWTQVEQLTQGKAGHDIEREYNNGMDNDGKPQWFALSVVGYGAKYELVVEDQSAEKKKATRKKKN